MKLRKATIADVVILAEWDLDDDVKSSGGDDDDWDWSLELNSDPPWREILIGEVGDEAVGVVVLINARQEDSHYWGDQVDEGAWAIDIWIGHPRNRSKGHGSLMMTQAVQRCFEQHKATQVLIDPLTRNRRAIEFYRRLGFIEVGPRIFDDDECLVMTVWSPISSAPDRLT